MESKTGTREWSDHSVNIQKGCEHGCRYCYAHYNAVLGRFKYMTQQQWNAPTINRKAVDKRYPKFRTKDGRPGPATVMIPTTHDITTSNLAECLIVINKLLIAGNNVLIVSKPHWPCITLICDTFNRPKNRQYKEQIMFRFTIGSYSDDVLSFWEPNAPNFAERMSCLQYAFNSGYDTSVSCEPYLDGYVDQLYTTCFDWVTESFWIGKMRQMRSRLDFSGISPAEHKRFVKPLLSVMNNKFVFMLYKLMKERPLVKWKDSIRKVIETKKV